MSQLRIFCTITAKNGERVPLEIPAETTPKELRAAVAGATKIPLGTLRLIYRGKMIQDETSTKVVDTYKLEADCVLHCMGQPVEAARPSEPAAAPVASMAPTAASAAVPSVASAAATATPAPPASAPVDVLSEALRVLRTSNSPEVYKTAVTTLSKILSNIAENPMEEKYRKVKKQNAAFQKRLGGLPGGDAAMRASGFVLGEDAGAPVYQLVPSPEAWPKLMAARAAVDVAATEAKRTPVPPVAPMAPIPPFGGMPPNMPGMPANMAEAMNDPRMQAGMERMMNNPEGLRAMMQVRPHPHKFIHGFLRVALLPTPFSPFHE